MNPIFSFLSVQEMLSSTGLFDASMMKVLRACGNMSGIDDVFSRLGLGLLLTVGVLLTGVIFGRILALLFAKTRREVLIFDCAVNENKSENAINDRELLEELLVCTQLTEERNASKERYFKWLDGHSELEKSESMYG